jgi:heme-degrading monooxygenase HmoA
VIARTWHGMVRAEDAEPYHAYLLETGVPDLRKTPGNRGVYVLRRHEGDRAHFLLISLWESREAIRAFAGDDLERARYYPVDAKYLLELEPRVTHYDVLQQPTDPAGPTTR